MALSEQQKIEVQEIAERFVGAFIKCNDPDSRYIVSGNACDSIDRAVELSMERCVRPPVDPAVFSAQEAFLYDQLAFFIKNLGCGE